MMKSETEYHSQTAALLQRSLDSRLAWAPDRREVPVEPLCSAINYLFAQRDLIEDRRRIDWLEAQCRNGAVKLLINGIPKGIGINVRAAIDDAMSTKF